MLWILLSPLLLAGARPAQGAQALKQCVDRAAGSEAATALCLDKAEADAEKRLKAAYRSALRRTPNAQESKRLRTSEAEWLKTRNDRCERDMRREAGDAPPGKADTLSLRFCGVGEVEQRILRLKRWR